MSTAQSNGDDNLHQRTFICNSGECHLAIAYTYTTIIFGKYNNHDKQRSSTYGYSPPS